MTFPVEGGSAKPVYIVGGETKFSPEAVIQVTPSDNLGISEFGETRTASPGNRSDVEFLYDKQPLLFEDISSGTGSATHRANSRDILLAVGGTATGATGGMRQKYWTPYTPGSGQEIDITGTLNAAGLSGGSVSVFLRSRVTGSTTLQTIPQSSWLALTSGVNWSYSQIFRMSFQSLRVGRIQYSMVVGGIPIKVAEITNDNIRATGYWQYASLPPYWKIYNDGTDTVAEFGYGDELNGIGFRFVFNGTQTSATAVAICETVKSQGGVPLLDLPGFPFSTPILSAKTVSTTLIPILSIRVSALFNGIANRTLIIPTAYTVQTDNPLNYAIYYRPTLTGPSWVSVDATNSGVEYDVTASAISGGVLVDTDYIASGINTRAGIRGLLERIILSLGNGATSDILTLAGIRQSTSNASVFSAFKWKEIR